MSSIIERERTPELITQLKNKGVCHHSKDKADSIMRELGMRIGNRDKTILSTELWHSQNEGQKGQFISVCDELIEKYQNIQFTRKEFSLNGSVLVVYHNLTSQFGLHIEGAFVNWMLREKGKIGAKNFCNYIESKVDEHVALTELQFKRFYGLYEPDINKKLKISK